MFFVLVLVSLFQGLFVAVVEYLKKIAMKIFFITIDTLCKIRKLLQIRDAMTREDSIDCVSLNILHKKELIIDKATLMVPYIQGSHDED